MKSRLRHLGEEGLLRILTSGWRVRPPAMVGVGDDCAVWRADKKFWLFKTDAVVEKVHFTAQTPGRLVGRKALARALSDIAAMGGKPLAAVVTLGVPKTISLSRLQEIYRGLTALAQTYQVQWVGGETTTADQLFLSIALWGEMKTKPILRSTAHANDRVWVTGTLGQTQKRKHLHFTPRLAEGQWLAQHGFATAMMDVSDGLAQDLPRLASASRLGFEIALEQLPRARGASLRQALGDGEDYELLFTTRPNVAEALLRRWPFPTRLTQVGRMVRGKGRPLLEKGYDHFA